MLSVIPSASPSRTAVCPSNTFRISCATLIHARPGSIHLSPPSGCRKSSAASCASRTVRVDSEVRKMNSTPQTESRDNPREIPGLPGEYVAGLIDGEGCLALGYRRTRNVLGGRERPYYSWQPQLAIVMHKRDK